MSAGQAESLESAAFYPFEDGTLTHLAIFSDITCRESDITSFVSFQETGLLRDGLNPQRVCFLYFLRCVHITHIIILGGYIEVTKC